MSVWDSVSGGVDKVTSGAGDLLDFGGSEAAEAQSAAAAAALKAQKEQALNAQKFMYGQLGEAHDYVDQGTDQASGALGSMYGQALGVQGEALGGQLGAYGQANQVSQNTLYSNNKEARKDLQATPNRMGDLYGGGLAAGFETDPGYQFRLSEGNKNIMQSAAARGGRMGGDTLKALQSYGQDLASQEYGNYANRQIGMAQGADQNDMSRNSQLAGMQSAYGAQSAGMASNYGSQVGNAYGQYGQGMAGTYGQLGSQLGNLYSQAGNNQANISMGASGQNMGLAQGMMSAYAAPTQYAGGAQSAQGQGLMNAAQLGMMAYGTFGGGEG